MLAETAQIDVVPGSAAAFEAAVGEARPLFDAASGCLVGVDLQGLFPNPSARAGPCQGSGWPLWRARRRQVEVDRRSVLVDGTVQVGPAPLHLYLGLVDPPAAPCRRAFPIPAQPPLHLEPIILDPAINRRVVDRDTALAQNVLEVAIADLVAAVLTHGPQDHLTSKMPPLEVAHHRPPASNGENAAPSAPVCNRTPSAPRARFPSGGVGAGHALEANSWK